MNNHKYDLPVSAKYTYSIHIIQKEATEVFYLTETQTEYKRSLKQNASSEFSFTCSFKCN